MKPYYRIGGADWEWGLFDSEQEAIDKATEFAKEKAGTTYEVLRCIALVSAPVPKPSTFWLDDEGLTEEEKPSDKKFEHMDDTMPCPSHRPNGWRQVKGGKVKKHDYVCWLEDGVGEWALEFIGEEIPKGDIAIYRQPDRF
jgi:hypothetical protein